MDRQGDEVHVTETEASGGGKPGVVRYILVISLLLVVIAMSAVWIFGAMRAPQGEHGGAVTNEAAPTPEAMAS